METETVVKEAPWKVDIRKEHHWLKRLIGEWSFEGEATMEIGKTPEHFEGTESVRSIGDVWIVAEGQSPMPDGTPVTMISTIGFDPLKERFVGSFIMSMETHLWIYEGELSGDEKTLTLHTEGPGMAAGKKIAKFQDSMEIISDDERVLTSKMLGDDGQWHLLMTCRYRRKHS